MIFLIPLWYFFDTALMLPQYTILMPFYFNFYIIVIICISIDYCNDIILIPKGPSQPKWIFVILGRLL